MEDIDDFKSGLITGVLGIIVVVLATFGWVHLILWIINQF